MNITNFDNDFESAIRLIAREFPTAEELIKPTLLHSIRVDMYLYIHNYDRDIAIEDTNITADFIEKKYSPKVAELVMANTKDESLDVSLKYGDFYTFE